MERWRIHWQDVVAMVAGAWLIVTVMAQISTATLPVGAAAFVSGAALLLLGAGALQDEHPGISWAMAAFGALAVLVAVVAGAVGETAVVWSMIIAGLVALGMSVWSALNKRGDREEIPGRREGQRVTLRGLRGDLRRATP